MKVKTAQYPSRPLGESLRNALDRQAAAEVKSLLCQRSPEEVAEGLAGFYDWQRELMLDFLPWCRARAVRRHLDKHKYFPFKTDSSKEYAVRQAAEKMPKRW